MVRLLKWLIGLLLLPSCVAVTRTLGQLLWALQPDSVRAVSLSDWGLFIGFALWVLLFFALPRPMRTYVLAHELTHALWGAVMGARIGRLKVSHKGGSVALSKTNFLIALAPYFFPLYTILVIALYLALSRFYDLRTYEPFWMGCVGLTWGFHLTFTLLTLRQRQPDIQEHGRLFSYAIIYLFNLLGICLWIVLITSPTLLSVAQQFLAETLSSWRTVLAAARTLWDLLQPPAR